MFKSSLIPFGSNIYGAANRNLHSSLISFSCHRLTWRGNRCSIVFGARKSFLNDPLRGTCQQHGKATTPPKTKIKGRSCNSTKAHVRKLWNELAGDPFSIQCKKTWPRLTKTLQQALHLSMKVPMFKPLRQTFSIQTNVVAFCLCRYPCFPCFPSNIWSEISWAPHGDRLPAKAGWISKRFLREQVLLTMLTFKFTWLEASTP